jgi:putative membrane protein
MLTSGALLLEWTFEPSVIAGLATLTLAYGLAVGPLRRIKGWGAPVTWNRQASFHLGTLALFLALVSPLDHLAEAYLQSAHMLQHVLLIFFSAPLWLLGMPDWLMARLIIGSRPKNLLGKLTSPGAAFLIFNATLLFWHLPRPYEAALESESIHALMHVSFLAAAVIGWWPVLGQLPQAAPRAPLPEQLLFLFLISFPGLGLAAMLTFIPHPLYPFYVQVERLFGLSSLADQQLAGLIMWLSGSFGWLLPFTIVFFKWSSTDDELEIYHRVTLGQVQEAVNG